MKKPVRLRARTRRGRGGGRTRRIRRGRRGGCRVGIGVRRFLGLLDRGSRIHDGCFVFGFLVRRRRGRSDNIGLLFARSKERRTSQNAEYFFHSLDWLPILGLSLNRRAERLRPCPRPSFAGVLGPHPNLLPQGEGTLSKRFLVGRDSVEPSRHCNSSRLDRVSPYQRLLATQPPFPCLSP